MISPSNPAARYLYDVAVLLDILVIDAGSMTVAPSATRRELLREAQRCLSRLHKMNEEHYNNKVSITDAINECEVGLQCLAELGGGRISENRYCGNGVCPCCGSQILVRKTGSGREPVRSCMTCSELYLPAYEKLKSIEGFWTGRI